MNKKRIPLMAQSMLRSLALVMFCESDMLPQHKPIGEEKANSTGSKLILDAQVKAMMQAKHALMAFERDAVREQLAQTHGGDVSDIVNEASRVYGRRAFGQAFRRQLRSVVGLLWDLPSVLRA